MVMRMGIFFSRKLWDIKKINDTMNTKNALYFKDESEMQILFHKARLAGDKWMRNSENRIKLTKEIAAVYLEEIHFKNDRITLVWTKTKFDSYMINVKILFLSKNKVELGEFVYSEDMVGNHIDDNFYFYHIYE